MSSLACIQTELLTVYFETETVITIALVDKVLMHFYNCLHEAYSFKTNSVHVVKEFSVFYGNRMFIRQPGSSVSIVSDYVLDDRAIRGSITGRGESIFPLASVSRPALRPTQPPVQWVPGVLSPEVKRGRGVTLCSADIVNM
jgi:hypothetical protein